MCIRDSAIGHHRKGQAEDCEDHLAPGRKGHRFIHGHMELACAHTHHGFGGVFPHLGGIGRDIPDGGALKHHPLDGPEQNAVSQGHAGKARRNSRGEGIDRRGNHTGSGAQQNDGDADHRVIARCQKYGNQQRIKGHGFLPHAIGGAAQAEKEHQNGNQPFLPAAQQADDTGYTCIHGAGLHHHAQKTAHHQDEYAHIHGVIKSRKRCLEHIADPLGGGGDRMIRPRLRNAVHIVIGSRRNHPGGCRHHQDQQKQNGIRRGHAEFGFAQRASPLIFRWWPPEQL